MILLLLHSKKLKKEKIMRKIVILLGIILFMIDNLTLPTAVARTNESGIATFILPQEEWFAAQSQRFFTFVVQEGGGPDNYQIWSSGRTVEAGKVVKIEIRLTQFPN